ncbi:hypothetical protein [Paenibacillus xylanexedens]|nr:hypothetical protein [Paenibacillus xylanexedens]
MHRHGEESTGGGREEVVDVVDEGFMLEWGLQFGGVGVVGV